MKARRRGYAVAARSSAVAPLRALRRPALPAGQLYVMVLAHLRAHPQLDFSPAELARALDRPTSRGAIIKICWRLVDENVATRTQERPERYRLAPAS